MMLTLKNSNNELIEDIQYIYSPVSCSKNICFWGALFHIKTPIENIPDHSTLHIKFFDDRKDENDLQRPVCTGWINYPIRKEIKSGIDTLFIYHKSDSMISPAIENISNSHIIVEVTKTNIYF
jgi:hypothetical protein